MALTISDLLKMPYFSNVEVVAGSKGLGKSFSSVGILDHEYAEGAPKKKQVFVRNDFLISSLLFAKEDPALLLDALEDLIGVGISAFAYQTDIIEDLPPEILSYADSRNFPILKFPKGMYFDEFLPLIADSLNTMKQIERREALISRLLSASKPRAELRSAVEELGIHSGRYLFAAYIGMREGLEHSLMERIYRMRTGVKRLDDRVGLARYRKGFFILLSDNDNSIERCYMRLDNKLEYLGIEREKIIIGRGVPCLCPEEADSAVQRAYYAYICARMRAKTVQDYEKMGLTSILIPHAGNPHLLYYMENYLAPILNTEDDRSSELLKTASSFVLNNGDYTKTAEELFVHKNTVRYRIGTLHELLDPEANDMEFNQRLSAAVKIYLINSLQE